MEYKVPSQCNSTWVNKISMEHKYCWYSATELLSLSPTSQCAHLPCSLASCTGLPSCISKSQLSSEEHHFTSTSLLLHTFPIITNGTTSFSEISTLEWLPVPPPPSSVRPQWVTTFQQPFLYVALRINLAQPHLCPPSCCESLRPGLCRNSPFWSALASQPKQSG